MLALEEAISLLDGIANKGSQIILSSDRSAIRLGIEALKAVVIERETYAFERIGTLPGETEEK